MRKSPVDYLVIVSIALVLAIIVGGTAIKCCGGANIEFSSGSRSGVIQKLSKRGVIWKTWEAEMNLGYNTASSDDKGNQTIAPAMFYFSVSDDSVAKIIKEAEIIGKRVTVEYKQYILRGYDKGATSYNAVGLARMPAVEEEVRKQVTSR